MEESNARVVEPEISPQGAKPDMDFIVTRAKHVMTDPKGVWETIRQEATSIPEIYKRYLMVLAAIPAVCQFISNVFIGIDTPVGTIRTGFIAGLFGGVLGYFMSLAMIYVYARIAQALAPKFEGTISELDSFKAVAYSATAALVGGIFGIIPFLGIISILLAVYSLYTYFQGLRALSTVRAEKYTGYFVTTLVCNILAGIALVLLVVAISPAPENEPAPAPDATTQDLAEGLRQMQERLAPKPD